MDKTAHCLVSGRVQHVAFRYFVLELATRYGLKGFVRNLPDGRVEIVAQGQEAVLDDFFIHLAQGNGLARVDKVAKTWVDNPECLHNFEIRR